MILEGSETGKGRHLGGYSMRRQALVKPPGKILLHPVAAPISGESEAR
jgi:hypothetical protein